MARQKEQARAAGKFKMAANLEYDGPATTFHGYDAAGSQGQHPGAVQGRRPGQ
jgi:alanyl-tRNA synthetase